MSIHHPAFPLTPTLLLIVSTSTACDLCGMPDLHDESEAAPGLTLGLDAQFTRFATLREDGHEIDDPTGQHMDSAITQLLLGWHGGGRWSLQAAIPWIDRSYRRPVGLAMEDGDEVGLGDASVLVGCTVWRHSDATWRGGATLRAGLKLPTGDSGRLAEEANEEEDPAAPPSGVHGHDLALGSGSWDGLFGFAADLHAGPWSLAASAQYALRTRGDHDYRYADDLTWEAAPGFDLWNRADGGVLTLQARLSGEHKGKDRLGDEEAEDTAVSSLYLGPAASLAIGRLRAGAGLDLPLVQRESAIQLVPDWRLHASLAWSL